MTKYAPLKLPPPPPRRYTRVKKRAVELDELGPGAKRTRGQEQPEFLKALSEYNPKKPRPTPAQLREIIVGYLEAEREEERLQIEIENLREERSALARRWLVLRGTGARMEIDGAIWSVRITKWGGFIFARYIAPVPKLKLDGDASDPEPKLRKRPPQPATGPHGRAGA